MEISGDIDQVDIALFCDQIFSEISTTSFFSSGHSRIYEHYDCQGVLSPPTPQLLSPPPPLFGNATEVDTEYPPWVFAVSLSLLFGGLSLCTGIILYGNCFMIAKDILNYIDDTIESIRIPRKKISKKTVPKMTNNELFTSAAINEQKKPIRPPSKRPTTTLNIAIPIPNIWSRALIADNSETQNDRVDVTSEPLIRSSTNLETSRRSFSDSDTTRRSSSVPKSRAHLRYRL